MKFLVAIDRMKKEELIEKIVYLETSTFNEFIKTKIVRGANKLLQITGIAAGKAEDFLKHSPIMKKHEKIEDVSGFLGVAAGSIKEVSESHLIDDEERNTILKNKVAKVKQECQEYSLEDLKKKYINKLARISGISEEVGPEKIALEMLKKAAKSVDVETEFKSTDEVEQEIVRIMIKKLVEGLREKLEKMDDAEMKKFEDLVRKELDKISERDRKLMEEQLGLEKLSEKALINMFKTGIISTGILVSANALGFGLFLALTTMLKSISLLIGVVFPFALYTTSTTVLGMLIGGIGGPILIAGTLFVAKKLSEKKYNQYLLTGEIVSMQLINVTER